MVIVLDAQTADTPEGKPVGAPIPVAPVVMCVMLGSNKVLIQSGGVGDGAPTVLFGLTVIVPVAVPPPQPPVNGML